MSRPPREVLVVGAGMSGLAAAIALRRRGFHVEVVGADAAPREADIALSLGGATLRALRDLGVLEAVLRAGHAADGVSLHLPDGASLGGMPTPRVAGHDVPGGAALLRPRLAALLAEAARAAWVVVRGDAHFLSMRTVEDGVDVSFADGSTRRYDLVVGADGVHSRVRAAMFPGAPAPVVHDQAVWRAVLPRPPEVRHAMLWLGSRVTAGVDPVSDDEMGVFVAAPRAAAATEDPAQQAAVMRALLEGVDAPLPRWIRSQLGARSRVHLQALETLSMPPPWHAGRVVLVGDAAHAATPHLAADACLGFEDGLVLAEELARDDDVDAALQRFERRRWPRCRLVVENSGRLGALEPDAGSSDQHARLMASSLRALAEPI